MRVLTSTVALLVMIGCSAPKSEAPAAAPAAPATMTITSKSPEAIEHLKKGEILQINQRTTEAVAEFDAALKTDPDFALAHAARGAASPGPDGLKELETAAAAAAALPAAERALIEGVLAQRQGEPGKARAAFTTMTTAAPGDWRGYYLLGNLLVGTADYSAAVPALRKGLELNPAAGGANNMLGYAFLQQGDVDGAIKAFTDYTSALPMEPNAQDSLGEALLAAGKFADAEAAFRRALELSPQFFSGWDGIAYARHYDGNAKGAGEALLQEKSVATRPIDQLGADELRAILLIAQGKTAEGLALYATLDNTPNAMPLAAFIPARRAAHLVALGRSREAMPLLAAAIKRAESGELPKGLAGNLRRFALRIRAAAEGASGDAAAAQQTASMLEQDAAERKDDPNAQSGMHYALGMAAIAKRDFAGAKGHFDRCLARDWGCRFELVAAAEKAGDAAAADAARQAILRLFVRDPVYVFFRSRLDAKPKAS
jgi:tetratricopeptide (TPR) repeat protein